MTKQEGADAHGRAGSYTGPDDGWFPEADEQRQSASTNNAKFNADKAARDAERNKGKGGK